MTAFAVTTTIAAPLRAVWNALADVGSIAVWNPGVEQSWTTSQAQTGLGATRHCDLGRRNYLDEEVVRFVEGEALTMRITATNLPFRRADIRSRLSPEGDDTVVEVAPDDELKYGPLGSLADRLFVRRRYERGMQALLRGLAKHVEQSAAS